MDKDDLSPNNPPSPTNTKRAAKPHKMHRPKGTRQTSQVSQIYRVGTDCIVADKATEDRLGPLGRGQLRDMTFRH